MAIVFRLFFLVCVLLGFPAAQAALAASALEAAPENQALSDAEIAKLLKLAVEHGHDTAIDRQVTAALGLTSAGQRVTYRQLSVQSSSGSARAFQQTGDGGYLLLGIMKAGNPDAFTAIRTDSRFELMAAVLKQPDQAPVVIPVNEAKAALKDALVFWRKVAAKF